METPRVRITELVADLVEPARTTALDKVGEGRHAMTIAPAWLRHRFDPSASESQEAG